MKVRTKAKRLLIIKTATELFKEFGYARASMNELARRLGGSKATLYGYFPSKEALFAEVVKEVATQHLTKATRNLQSDSKTFEELEDVLLSFARSVLQVISNDSDALAVERMVIAESGHSDVGEIFYESGPKESFDALAIVLTHAIELGLLRKADPRVLAEQFLSLVVTEVENRVFQRSPRKITQQEIQSMATRAVELFLFGSVPR